MSQRASFLIIVAGLALHVSVPLVCLTIIGYWIFEWSDKRQAKHENEKVFAQESDDWERDPVDPRSEIRSDGSLTRVKLTDSEQVIAARIVELLRTVRRLTRTY